MTAFSRISNAAHTLKKKNKHNLNLKLNLSMSKNAFGVCHQVQQTDVSQTYNKWGSRGGASSRRRLRRFGANSRTAGQLGNFFGTGKNIILTLSR